MLAAREQGRAALHDPRCRPAGGRARRAARQRDSRLRRARARHRAMPALPAAARVRRCWRRLRRRGRSASAVRPLSARTPSAAHPRRPRQRRPCRGRRRSAWTRADLDAEAQLGARALRRAGLARARAQLRLPRRRPRHARDAGDHRRARRARCAGAAGRTGGDAAALQRAAEVWEIVAPTMLIVDAASLAFLYAGVGLPAPATPSSRSAHARDAAALVRAARDRRLSASSPFRRSARSSPANARRTPAIISPRMPWLAEIVDGPARRSRRTPADCC